MICEKCGKEFFEDWRKDKDFKKNNVCKFCCRSCSNSRNQTERMNKKRKETYLKALAEGKYNTKKKPREKKYCIDCGKELSLNNKSGKCASCSKIKNFPSYNRRYKKIFKEKLIDLMGGKCEMCGYNKCSAALEFHHKDPLLKEFSLSQKGIIVLENIKEELNKCMLLCANCHREIHHKK